VPNDTTRKRFFLLRPGCAVPLGVIAALYGWWLVGRLRYEAIAQRQVTRLYSLLEKEDYESINREGLEFTPFHLQAAAEVVGPVEKFTIVDTTCFIEYIPMSVTLSVTRRGVARKEKVLMMFEDGRRLMVTLPLSNDQLWETNRRAKLKFEATQP
jgi:hypothetical protein